ncbi:UbiA family prenyltransferase [Kitasatospora sp. NBC_01539]|uniref:UbiA family prenyltransferase n=1 Tax=Kitasatospora sp. NBC_01539 TaxID=2903577 RepID=UPI00386030A2
MSDEAVSPAGRPAARPRWRPGLLLAACHPAPAAAVTAFAVLLAVGSGRPAGAVALTGAAVAAGQLSIGWCNDRVDLARDAAAGRADKPLARGAVSAPAVGAAAGAALVLAVPLSLAAAGPVAGGAHLAGVAAGWAYNLRLKGTVLSWLPYAVAFGLLPVFVTAGPGRPWPAWWVTAAAALLGCGAHAANVLPDIAADRAAGVLGLPQRLGRRRSAVLASGCLAGATAVLVLGPGGPVGAVGATALAVASAAAVLAPAAPGRWPFLGALALAGLDVALLLGRGTGRAA